MMLSVIVPVWNAAPYLEECLSSLAYQKMAEMEVLLVDDGSTDRSAEICGRYAENDSRFRVIRRKHYGVSAARNAGLEKAVGEWILFLDADDAMPEGLADSFRFETYRESEIVFLGHSRIREVKPEAIVYPDLPEGQMKPEKVALLCRALLNPEAFRKEGISLRGMALNVVWAKFFRREFLQRNGITFDSGLRFAEDYLFCFRCYACGPSCFVSRICGCRHRLAAGGPSMSQRYDPEIVSAYRHLSDAVRLEKERVQPRVGPNDLDMACCHWFRRCCDQDFFHPDNPKSLRERKADFLSLLKTDEFTGAFRNPGLRKLKLKSRVFPLFCRFHCFLLAGLVRKNQRRKEANRK